MTSNQRSVKSGLPPGTIVHIGEKKRDSVEITLVKLSAEFFTHKVITSEDLLSETLEDDCIYWINVDGLQDTQTIDKIGKKFSITSLVLEDITNTVQRPKTNELSDYLHVILKTISTGDSSKLIIEQVSIIIGKNFVITFTENRLENMNDLTRRMDEFHKRFFDSGTDFLAYSIIDGIVDKYFFALENISDNVESMEKQVLSSRSQQFLEKIYDMKKELLLVQRNVRPLRDVINSIIRSDNPIIKSETLIYFRDVYDHISHISDNIDVFRDMTISLVDIYLSSTSNRLNEVMKVLTIISTVFMPLSFIAGVYGMNFKIMPELESPLGYPIVLSGMLLIGAAMLFYFKKKRWY